MPHTSRRSNVAAAVAPVLPHRPSELIFHISTSAVLKSQEPALRLNFVDWIITWGNQTYVCRTAKGMLLKLRILLHSKTMSKHDTAPLLAILALAHGKVSEAFQHLSINPEIGKSFDRSLSQFFGDGQLFSDEFHRLAYDLEQAGL